jgi:hypothetical protein
MTEKQLTDRIAALESEHTHLQQERLELCNRAEKIRYKCRDDGSHRWTVVQAQTYKAFAGADVRIAAFECLRCPAKMAIEDRESPVGG